MKKELIIPMENIGEISDGYHTFNELYDHKHHLFIALMRSNPGISWRANKSEDGTLFFGSFIAGMDLPSGPISYHIPLFLWNMLDGLMIDTKHYAPKRDGCTSEDIIKRLAKWFESDE